MRTLSEKLRQQENVYSCNIVRSDDAQEKFYFRNAFIEKCVSAAGTETLIKNVLRKEYV